MIIILSFFTQVTGIEDLHVFDSGLVRFDSNSSLGDMTHRLEFHLNSLHVQDGGTFELKSYEKDLGMNLQLSNLTVSSNLLSTIASMVGIGFIMI